MFSATYLFHKQGIRSSYREEGTWVLPSDSDPSQRNMSHQKLLASWVKEMEKLNTSVSSQPHAGYAAIAHGLSGKWTHLARTVLGTSNLIKPLEEVIRHRFIPALIGRSDISNLERELLFLPTRLGGLSIMNPSEPTISQ